MPFQIIPSTTESHRSGMLFKFPNYWTIVVFCRIPKFHMVKTFLKIGEELALSIFSNFLY